MLVVNLKGCEKGRGVGEGPSGEEYIPMDSLHLVLEVCLFNREGNHHQTDQYSQETFSLFQCEARIYDLVVKVFFSSTVLYTPLVRLLPLYLNSLDLKGIFSLYTK